jgi:hypothetical protein
MTRLVLILLLTCCALNKAFTQSFTVDDLLTLSSQSPRNFDNYMGKKGFVAGPRSMQNDAMAITFIEKKKPRGKDSLMIFHSVDLYKKDDTYCFAYHTSSGNEYVEGRKKLVKAGFLCDVNPDTSKPVPMMFQKRNVTVQSGMKLEDGEPVYSFLLQKKALPDPSAVQFAEDLLRFDSHEYMVSFFGEKNVKKDVYYFDEKELRKCSVLFPNTSQQALFIWDDQANYRDLGYVLISGILPTLSAVQFSGYVSQNKWTLRNGLYSGMSIKELMRLNNADFEFYGRNSEFSFMISPGSKGDIDFKNTGIMLGCIDCSGHDLLNKEKISAAEALDHNLVLHVFYIMITPPGKKVEEIAR